MSPRRLRVLTLVLLSLLIAAPLSSGDKGLWLSLTSTPAQVVETVAGDLPAEHAILIPERATRAGRAQALPRAGRVDTARAPGPAGAAWAVWVGPRWMVPDAAAIHPHGEPAADRPAPRAPPA